MLIFLDIDGVMTSANSWKQPELLNDGFAMFSSNATEALKKILAQTHAAILLTTSHKANYSSRQWTRIFKERGIKAAKIQSLPENLTRLSRKDEIMTWFSTHPASDNFVIIDDDKSLNDLPPFLKKKLILTSGSVGLTDELADRAISLLKSNQQSALA